MSRLCGVIDLGKTHGRLLAFDDQGTVVHEQRWASGICTSETGYQALDVAATERQIEHALRGLGPLRQYLGRLIVSAHGAAVAGLTTPHADHPSGTLAIAPPDYEWPGFEDHGDQLSGELDSFTQTLSPVLPRGLNIGVQLDWLSRHAPHAMAGANTLLPYAQYWAWWLSGVASSEVSSLGCHTLLWRPREQAYSSWAKARGWADRFAPLRSAWQVLGPVRPELAKRLGLPADTLVHVGVHDSNACLAAYLRHWPTMTLVSSGTWVVVMAPGAAMHGLEGARDQLGSVSVHGRGVATARFMGGRELAVLCAGADPQLADIARLGPLLARGLLMTPSFETQGGPFKRHTGALQIDGRPLTLDEWSVTIGPTDRATAAALYTALMTTQLIQALDARGPVVLDGPLATNAVAAQVLAALLPADAVHVNTDSVEGTARGAWRLAHWESGLIHKPSLMPVRTEPRLSGSLRKYFKRWLSQLPSHPEPDPTHGHPPHP